MNRYIINILMKDYDVMRSEIRLYINKFYLGLTAILGILTVGIFQQSDNSMVYLCVPYAVASLIGFLAMVSFFVNKTAGYVSLIEHRIARMTDTHIPSHKLTSTSKITRLSPIFWESYYADIGMERDLVNHFSSLFSLPIAAILVPSTIMLTIIIHLGFQEISSYSLPYAWTYCGTSVGSLLIAGVFFTISGKNVRSMLINLNSNLLEAYNDNLSENSPNKANSADAQRSTAD